MKQVTASPTSWEQHLQPLFAQSPLAVAVVQWPSGRFTFANPPFQRWLAQAGEPGQCWPEQAAEPLTDLLNQVYRRGEAAILPEHETYLTEGGVARRAYFHWAVQPFVADTGAMSMLIQGTDLTACVDARKRVEQQAEHLHYSVELNPQVPWTADATGNIDGFNERWLTLTGLAREEALGEGWAQVPHPDDRPAMLAAWTRAVQTATPYDIEHRIRLADGTHRWMRSRATPRLDGRGNVLKWYGTTEDIHDRKQAELHLIEQEAFIRSVLESSPDCVKVLDATGRLQHMNQNGLCQMEIDDFCLVDGQPWWSLWPSESRPAIEGAVRQALGGETVRLQAFCPTAKGTPKWWDVIVTPVTTHNAPVSGIVSVSRDITGQKEAEAHLRLAAERADLAQEAAKASLYEYIPQANQVVRNASFVAVAGYQPGDLPPTVDGWRDLMHPDDRDKAWQTIRQAIDNRQGYSLEYRMQHRHGHYLWFHDSARVILNEQGEVERVVGMLIDVNVLKQLEATLREQFEEMENIYQNAPVGLGVLDRDYRFRRINERLAEMNGFPAHDHIGRTIYEVVPSLAEQAASVFRQVFETSQPLLNVELRGETEAQPGVERCWNESWYPLKDERGETFAVSVVVEEITQRKKAEEALRTFSEKLENEVAQRTQQLRLANAGLERSNEYLQQFAYVASHDLQEPLRKIQSFGNLLLADYQASLGPEGRDMLQRMQRAAGRMSELVRDLLAYSRLTTRQQPFRQVALGEVVEAVLGDLELVIQQANAQVSVGTLPTLLADPSQMQQLFGNLFGNALRYVAPGVAPRLSLSHRQIEASALPAVVSEYPLLTPVVPEARQAQFYHEISLTDNGIGFDEKYLDRIFGMFQRLVGKSQYEGSGMGLAICKRVVDNHHGVITARSQPGQGSTFLVYLPA